MNRSKTRKWVEAKKQTYDGDDWGNDFEDDENEPDEEAPPPPRTAGMRQVGQDVQQPSQQPSGSRSVSQPTSAFGHIRGQSFGRNPSGPPALQLQTQQPTPSQHFDPVETFSTYEAPSAGGGPDYRYAAPVTSPQSGGTRPFPQEPGYAGRKDYSQVPQDRGSPALTSAGPAQRFPPRKSSMGQQDAPTHGDTASSRSGSRPGSSGRPWVDQRSNSPGRQASPPVGLPSKPLPFIRPADIYRRMEEEKEKERKSMDSAGRPSIDSIPGVGSDRSSSPANVVRPLADQRRRTSFDRDESVDSSRGLKPTLTPVAEGRSESGLDRLPTGVNPEASDITGREATHRPQEATTSTHVVEPVSQPSFQRPSNNPEDRRKSISPRLPDLTRLSGFGADFFSGPSEFPGAGHLSNPATPESEPRASYSEPDQQLNEQSQATPVQFDTARQLSPTSSHSTEPTLTKHVPSDDGSVALLPSSLTAGPALVNRMDTPLHVPQQEQPSPNTASSDTRDSSPSGNNTITERLKPSRPSIPGGWVTETTVLGSETPTPMERPDPSVSQLSPVQDISEASPVTGLEVDDLVPTTVVNQTPSLADGSVAVARKQIKQTEAGDDFGQTTGHHDQEIASEAVAAGPGFNSTVRTLPPLETPNPLFVSNTSPVVGAAAHTSEAKSSPPYEDSPSKHSASTHPSAVNASSAFSPIAPLNTKGSNVSVSDFTPPQFLSRNVTMSSMDTGSPNESDRLRDDIINSLSPINPATVFSAPSAAPYSAGGSSPEMARESRYLSGVYDDYMGFVEDKTLPETAQEFKDKRANAADSPEQSYPLQTVVADSRLVSSTDSSGAGKAPKTVPSLQSRFSWEGGSEQALAPNEGNRPHISEAEEVHDSAATTRQSASPEPQESMPAPALQVEREHDGTISHQVSLLSSHAPAGLGVSGMELPSPISVLSSDRSFGVAENQGRRLSLAEEKVLIRVSSNPVSPSPPQGEHPALARTPPAEPLPVPDVTNPLPPPPKSTNLTGWRDILSLPSPALRIQKFDETRSQYLSMDSGLSNWLEHMDTLSEHGARQSPRGPPPDLHTSGGPAPGPLTASPTGVPAPTQQPYYQQYLNASNPNLMVGPLPSGPVRPPTGNLASSGQPAVSGFGNPPKTQVGAKSKELLQAASVFGNKATKAGMKSGLKLFNKGKDRLRGNGDKV